MLGTSESNRFYALSPSEVCYLASSSSATNRAPVLRLLLEQPRLVGSCAAVSVPHVAIARAARALPPTAWATSMSCAKAARARRADFAHQGSPYNATHTLPNRCDLGFR